MKISKINDIALKAGVSPSTVSRVFNNRPYVKEEIRRHVLNIAVEMDYSPKATARRDTISVIVNNWENVMENSYAYSMISSFYAVAGKLNLHLEIVALDEIDRIYQNFSKAVIAMTYDGENEALRKIKNIPVVMVNCIMDGINYICTDHRGGMYRATKYLIENGHRDIALFFLSRYPLTTWGDRERLAGYRAALEDAGLEFRRELVVCNAREALLEIARLLKQQHPTALIGSGESLFMPMRHALELLDKRIPEDISLVSFYVPGVTPYILPEMTCVQQDFHELVRICMEKVVGLIQGEEDRFEIMLESKFIEGHSVKRLNESIIRR